MIYTLVLGVFDCSGIGLQGVAMAPASENCNAAGKMHCTAVRLEVGNYQSYGIMHGQERMDGFQQMGLSPYPPSVFRHAIIK